MAVYTTHAYCFCCVLFLSTLFIFVVTEKTTTTSSSSTLWVDSNKGADVDNCGVDVGSPCASFGFTLQRALLVAETSPYVTIQVQSDIHNEHVNFVDTRLVIANLTVLSNNSIFYNSDITLKAYVVLNNMKVDSSKLHLWRVDVWNIELHSTQVNGVSFGPNNQMLPSIFNINFLVSIDSSLTSHQLFGSSLDCVNTTFLVSQDFCSISDSLFAAVTTIIPAISVGKCSVSNSHFENNAGGAILASGELTLVGTEFVGNKAQFGGAIHALGPVTLTDCTLQDNVADYGGAIYAYHTIHLIRSTLNFNTAQNLGGGVYFNTGFKGEVIFFATDSNIKSNRALYGGGVAVAGGRLTLNWNDTTASLNAATNNGASLYATATVVRITGWKSDSDSRLSTIGIFVANSTVSFISSSFSDGMQASNSLLTLENTTVAGEAVLVLRKSSSLASAWSVTLSDASKLDCDDCAAIFCPATHCTDCQKGCLQYPTHAICATNHTDTWGCVNHGTCKKVQGKTTTCSCTSGFGGNLCEIQIVPDNKKGTDKTKLALSIVLPIVGVAIAGGILVWYLRYRRNRYSAIQ